MAGSLEGKSPGVPGSGQDYSFLNVDKTDHLWKVEPNRYSQKIEVFSEEMTPKAAKELVDSLWEKGITAEARIKPSGAYVHEKARVYIPQTEVTELQKKATGAADKALGKAPIEKSDKSLIGSSIEIDDEPDLQEMYEKEQAELEKSGGYGPRGLDGFSYKQPLKMGPGTPEPLSGIEEEELPGKTASLPEIGDKIGKHRFEKEISVPVGEAMVTGPATERMSKADAEKVRESFKETYSEKQGFGVTIATSDKVHYRVVIFKNEEA